ncbi:MAG: deoxyguanosinetriphosphate triphosphohydrolase family protein [Kineosporiaceae bacterium]
MTGAASPIRAERRHPDKRADARSSFQRDRDRLIYTDAFRRLAGVTQVISALEGHVYHNRLTHTIKVAQVARRLAERLADQGRVIAAREGVADPPLSPDVAEAAALAHDLGHPPFGHVGEQELQRLLEPLDPADSFEGNAQSFRIVTRISRSQARFVGINLTRATLLAILKYPWLRHPDHPLGVIKWGAYSSELDDFRFAKQLGHDGPLPAPGEPLSLEALVMDWADDITYAVHDIEDLFRAGLIPLDRLAVSSRARSEFATWVHERWRSHGRLARLDDIARSLKAVRSLLGIWEPFQGTSEHRTRLRTFCSVLIHRYVQSTAVVHTDAGWRLDISPEIRLEVDVLKELTWFYVIERPNLATQRHGHRAVIRGLFEVYMDAADTTNSAVSRNILPPRVREDVDAAAAAGLATPATRARIVCDAICSMTDEEALRAHTRFTGHTLGSVFDPVI